MVGLAHDVLENEIDSHSVRWWHLCVFLLYDIYVVDSTMAKNTQSYGFSTQ